MNDTPLTRTSIAAALAGAAGFTVGYKLYSRPSEISWDRVARQVPHGDHSRFLSVDGLRVHYQEFGDAGSPPIILIHGYTASVFAWHTAAPMLANAGFRVIAIDLIGFGYSAKPRWFDYSITSQAAIIAKVMARLGVGRAVVAGSSYGGAVALTLALDHGEVVEKLVLLDAVCNDEALQHPLLRLAAYRLVGEAITPVLLGSTAVMRRRMRNTLARANHSLITKDRVANILRPLSATDAHHSVLTTARRWSASRLERDARFIRVPTLIIWGEEDTVIGIHNGYKLHAAIPNSRFFVLRNCGHVPAEEKSDEVVELISRFTRSAQPAIAGR